MRKLFLCTAAGFLVTGIFLFVIAHASGLRIFVHQAAQAGRGAFSEIFHRGNSEHMAAEINLGENASVAAHAEAGTGTLSIAAISTKNIFPKTAKTPFLESATSAAKKNKPAGKVAATPIVASSENIAALKISEIMAGASSSPSDEFIELTNLGNMSVDMTGWSIKKKTASGAESTLVSASRFAGKIILPHGYLLLANSGRWSGNPVSDILWPASYSLSYTSNTITLYASGGVLTDSVSWSEIPSGKSYARDPIDGKFVIEQVPTPQGSGK